jgi:hypothetical protein
MKSLAQVLGKATLRFDPVLDFVLGSAARSVGVKMVRCVWV